MKKRLIKLAIVLAVLFAGWVLIAPFLAERLIVEKPLEKADAMFVLGGSSVYIERTNKAAELYKAGVAAKIYLTDDGERGGWSKKEQRNPAFYELAENNLIAHGVPAENIEVIKPPGSGTIYEARFFAEKAKESNLKSVLLVTSAYHTRRARWIFEKVFAESAIETEIGIVAPPVGFQTPVADWWWLKAKGLSTIGGEYVKTFGYWLFY